jgi:hypothetical protein
MFLSVRPACPRDAPLNSHRWGMPSSASASLDIPINTACYPIVCGALGNLGGYAARIGGSTVPGVEEALLSSARPALALAHRWSLPLQHSFRPFLSPFSSHLPYRLGMHAL